MRVHDEVMDLNICQHPPLTAAGGLIPRDTAFICLQQIPRFKEVRFCELLILSKQTDGEKKRNVEPSGLLSHLEGRGPSGQALPSVRHEECSATLAPSVPPQLAKTHSRAPPQIHPALISRWLSEKLCMQEYVEAVWALVQWWIPQAVSRAGRSANNSENRSFNILKHYKHPFGKRRLLETVLLGFFFSPPQHSA